MSMGLHLLLGRRSGALDVAGAVRLDRYRVAAGETLAGTVTGATRGEPVELFRIERQPRGLLRLAVAEAPSSAMDGRFALTVPPSALPSATGRRCAVDYVAAAGADQRAPSTRLVVLATAVPHLDPASRHGYRLLRDFGARDFHIELCEADPRGGGTLAFRVHRHGAWPAAGLTVTARCIECWCAASPAARGTPEWREDALWEEKRPLSVVTDSHWARVAFALPEDLPPAVEARTIAWRYELLARATVHRWLSETAVTTPLLYEEALEQGT
jgi:hypothetical protein